ncbi:uroporphyrinogen-III C-methyltransferase [Alkalimonas collagenimarina]|uniref:Uroporphyrinogen-III C-methyltransferase n=1 Tax=Alkalimonas collagenimarina TaxID=400390 RepID=A0ABT9GXE0_9GAMM|nr:uroporphyrinogen-III C-methyltransferase [Alkalimonas collagenimarina]MDP4535724.1 uroporphyrinogen-III C-methyltransferase [Alkalimonas collagenimarina]
MTEQAKPTKQDESVASVDDDMRYLQEDALVDEPPKSGRGLAGFALFYSLVLTGILVAGGYWAYPEWQQLSQHQQVQQSQLQQQLDAQQAELERTMHQGRQEQQQQLDQWQQQSRQQLNELTRQQQQQQQQFQQQLRMLEQRLSQEQGAAPSVWLLAEVDYLLRMASQKLWLELDVETAKQLLRSADSRLARLAEPALLSVREAIRQDQQALSQLSIPDPTEVQLTIRQWREVAHTLPFKDQHADSAAKPDEAEETSWRQRWYALWQGGLSQVLQVRSTVEDDVFSVSTEEQRLIRHRLQQQLVQAELAAMQQQTKVFQANLREAADLIQRYFQAEHADTQRLSAALVALVGTELHPGYIAPLQSVDTLQRYQRNLELLGDDAGGEL